jgi:hypothetical protein
MDEKFMLGHYIFLLMEKPDYDNVTMHYDDDFDWRQEPIISWVLCPYGGKYYGGRASCLP